MHIDRALYSETIYMYFGGNSDTTEWIRNYMEQEGGTKKRLYEESEDMQTQCAKYIIFTCNSFWKFQI